MEKALILLAAYNVGPLVGEVIERIRYPRNHILVVDDGSTDNTSEVARSKGVIVIRHTRNLGKGAAHKTGFRYAVTHGYDYVITIDADGQHDPDEIPRFMEAIKHYDMVIGRRYFSWRNMPIVRVFTNVTTSFIVSLLSGQRLRDVQSGYRAIRRTVIERVRLRTNRYQTESEIIVQAARLGFRIGEIPISTIYRREARSHINPIIDTLRFIKFAISSLRL